MAEPFPYEDIIDLDRPVSRKHPPMSMDKRAALGGARTSVLRREVGVHEDKTLYS